MSAVHILGNVGLHERVARGHHQNFRSEFGDGRGLCHRRKRCILGFVIRDSLLTRMAQMLSRPCTDTSKMLEAYDEVGKMLKKLLDSTHITKATSGILTTSWSSQTILSPLEIAGESDGSWLQTGSYPRPGCIAGPSTGLPRPQGRCLTNTVILSKILCVDFSPEVSWSRLCEILE